MKYLVWRVVKIVIVIVIIIVIVRKHTEKIY